MTARVHLRAALLSTALMALLAALSGCGSSGASGNGIQAKSAAQILQAAKTAAAQAQSVHIEGSIVSEGRPISLNMELLSGQGGKGRISQDGFQIQLIQTGGSVYINGSAAFYQHVSGSAAAQLLQGRWLKAPADSGELASLASLTDLGRLLGSTLAGHGALSKAGTARIEGQLAVALKDSAQGGVLYVATTGKPYPLELLKSGSAGGKVIFDRWDQPVKLSAPAGAIDISKLQG